jgi:hypothetical protein
MKELAAESHHFYEDPYPNQPHPAESWIRIRIEMALTGSASK